VIRRLYGVLLREYGPQGWWPLTSLAGRPGFDGRGYHPGVFSYPRAPAQRFEIVVGAVLTQNTAWANVEKALASLSAAGVRTPGHLLSRAPARLSALVRSSGYHNQKARTLRVVARFFHPPGRLRAGKAPGRDELLALRGIGEETADSILLYAFGEPVFVVDAYTRRLLSRLGIAGGGERYGAIQEIFHRALPRDPVLFGEYHALIVAHAKARCRVRPLCGSCPVPRCPARGRRDAAGWPPGIGPG
jgi:endonuclease III related protein